MNEVKLKMFRIYNLLFTLRQVKKNLSEAFELYGRGEYKQIAKWWELNHIFSDMYSHQSTYARKKQEIFVRKKN